MNNLLTAPYNQRGVTNVRLREELVRRGLRTSGNKSDLIQRLIDDDNSVALAQNNQHDLFSRPHQTPVSIHNLARSSPFNVSGDLNHILAGNDHFQRFFNHALHNPGSSFGHRASTNQYLHGANIVPSHSHDNTPDATKQVIWKKEFTPFQPVLHQNPFIYIPFEWEFVTKPKIIPIHQRGNASREWILSDDHFKRLNNNEQNDSETVPSIYILCFEESAYNFPSNIPKSMQFPIQTILSINKEKRIRLPPMSKYPIDLTPFLRNKSNIIPKNISLRISWDQSVKRTIFCFVLGEKIPVKTIVKKMESDLNYTVNAELSRLEFFGKPVIESKNFIKQINNSNQNVIVDDIKIDEVVEPILKISPPDIEIIADNPPIKTVNTQVISPSESNDSDDLVASFTLLSIKDPLTLQLLQIPCRGASCTHASCFDLTSFLQMNTQNLTLKCPICSKDIRMIGGHGQDAGIIVQFDKRARKRDLRELDDASNSTPTLFDIVSRVEFKNLGPDLLICGYTKLIINDIKEYVALNSVKFNEEKCLDDEEEVEPDVTGGINDVVILKDGSWYVPNQKGLGNASEENRTLNTGEYDLQMKNKKSDGLNNEIEVIDLISDDES